MFNLRIFTSNEPIYKIQNKESPKPFSSSPLLPKNILKWGRGFWRFNNLTDKNYVDIIKKTIDDVEIQYLIQFYNAENLLNIENETIQFTIKDQTFKKTLITEIK